jgi:hypothetical protein
MRQQERDRAGLGRAHVEEVDRLAVDLGRELVELVERGLLCAPVEPVPPVVDEAAQVCRGDPTTPVVGSVASVAGRVGRPAGVAEPCEEVVEV